MNDTTNPHKAFILQALAQMRSDDPVRVRHAFRNCTPEQMQQEYGESGQTRAEILAGSEEHESRIVAAEEWLRALPDDDHE